MIVALLAFAWIVGIAAAAYTGADGTAIPAAAALALLSAFLVLPRRSILIASPFVLAIVILAFVRYEDTVLDPTDGVGYLNGSGTVTLRGVVDSTPSDRPTSRVYEVAVSAVKAGSSWDDTPGRILLRVPAHSSLAYGDEVELHGKLEEPESFGDFDYSGYLLRRDITSVATFPEITVIGHSEGDSIEDRLVSARANIEASLSANLPEPESSLAAGILIGSGSIPADLRADMATTGTSHLVAVSGQNIAMLGALVVAALAWLIGRRPAAWAAIAAIGVYTLLVGPEASVIRAAIMGGLYVLATVSGRQNAAALSVVYAAAIMTALDPQAVHDIGFQLSFAATIGLIFLSPVIARSIRSSAPFPQPISEMLAITLAAIAATLPITAINFGTVSLIAPIANLFVVPAFVAVAATSAVLILIDALAPSLSSLASLVAYLPATYMVRAMRFFADVPGASVNVGEVTVLHAVAWYCLLAAGAWWLSQRPDDAPPPAPGSLRRFAALGGLAASIAVLSLVVSAASTQSDGRMSVTVLDVGQGDAILIEDRSGGRVLVDAGPRGNDLALALGRHLPLGDRRIDVVVITHPQGDHEGGLDELLASYDVSQVMTAAEGAAGGSVSVTTPRPGQTIAMDGGTLTVLQATPVAEDVNDTSVVLRLDAGETSFLLTGDISEEGEQALVASGVDLGADVLKVAHHGSRFSSGERFLERVGARVSLISAGESNLYGHPSPEVLDRLGDSEVFRTDQQGDVTITTDGQRVWVDTAR